MGTYEGFVRALLDRGQAAFSSAGQGIAPATRGVVAANLRGLVSGFRVEGLGFRV